MLRPIVKRSRGEIGSAWPNDGVNLRIERHLSERRWVVKRTVKLALKNRLEVNSARQAVVEMQAQRIRRDALEGGDAVNWVIHGANLPQRLDWGRLSALYQKRPIGEQFFLVKLGPSFDETLLALWDETDNERDGHNGKYGNMLAIIGVKMWDVMALGGLGEHPNDDPVKA